MQELAQGVQGFHRKPAMPVVELRQGAFADAGFLGDVGSASGRNRRLPAAIGRSVSLDRFFAMLVSYRILVIMYSIIPYQTGSRETARIGHSPAGRIARRESARPARSSNRIGKRLRGLRGVALRTGPGPLRAGRSSASTSALWAFSRSNRSGVRASCGASMVNPPSPASNSRMPWASHSASSSASVEGVPVISSPARGSRFRIAPKRSRYSQNCRLSGSPAELWELWERFSGFASANAAGFTS